MTTVYSYSHKYFPIINKFQCSTNCVPRDDSKWGREDSQIEIHLEVKFTSNIPEFNHDQKERSGR